MDDDVKAKKRGMLGRLKFSSSAAKAFSFSRGLVPTPTIRLSERQLLARLQKPFPIKKNYLFIFDLTLDNPRLDLHAYSDDQRFLIGLDVLVHLGAGSSEVFQGALDIRTGLAFDNRDGTIALTQPEVYQLIIKGLPEGITEPGRMVINEIVNRTFDHLPVYQLEAETRSGKTLRRMIRDVRVGQGEIIVHLGVNFAGDGDQAGKI
ncbi:hypothetical protein OLMES_0575 [Oleiphilus messinensis]|uniref:Uncharacterized protein n=1 Tax=Oleiphilus messinensis TaxID=141451 RepID=A0A1Y0I2F2_9GAMM|nr:DUF1439 domain-containing protein [Oleiphilus messinensis]ARU54678.1 hypothetical protein OLMES_0575 [Oleiphilus messinensis]